MNESLQISDNAIASKIYIVRGRKVMIDRDLALLYKVPTKQLKRQVKRNLGRFPDDFMFEMNRVEFKEWRRQFGTSKSDKMGLRYIPFCFTEQGIAMLSSVLNSNIAIEMNIRIIRVFTRMREMVSNHKDAVQIGINRRKTAYARLKAPWI